MYKLLYINRWNYASLEVYTTRPGAGNKGNGPRWMKTRVQFRKPQKELKKRGKEKELKAKQSIHPPR